MTRPRVLVVEDDDDLREALCEILAAERLECLQAANGRQALERLRAGPRPDVILLDLMMPVMSGWDFRRAQLDAPDLAEIPVVVMTAARNVDHEALQADEYVSKPVDVEHLIALVERYKS